MEYLIPPALPANGLPSLRSSDKSKVAQDRIQWTLYSCVDALMNHCKISGDIWCSQKHAEVVKYRHQKLKCSEGILLNMNGKLTIGKLKSTFLS